MNRFILVLGLVSALAPSLNAGQLGAAHNRNVECVRRALPPGPPSARVILNTLVANCRYVPPAENARNFVETYAPLVDSTLRGVQGESLSPVISAYRSHFTDVHVSYLNQIETILKGNNPREAAALLDRLLAQASRTLTGSTNPDVAVLAAIDIAASSTRYWNRTESDDDHSIRAKWWQIILADVAGGIVGGVFGGGVGAVGLGSACSVAVAGA